MKYRLVIFDMDGTILDTLDDLAISCNYALALNGMPTHPVDDVRRFVGNGVERLIRRAVPNGTGEDVIMKTLADFRAHYNAHSNDHTRPYDGILPMLNALKAAGIRIAVHSNKYDSAVCALCDLHFDSVFDAVAGAGDLSPHKPDPAGAFYLMKQCCAAPAETLYVGDSEVDMATARNAHIDAAWVSWGFRREDEMDTSSAIVHFEHPEDIITYLFS